MRLSADPEQVVNVVWSFADDNATALTGLTPFRSANWAGDFPPLGAIGEIADEKRPWSRGDRRGVPQPSRRCGDGELWRRGIVPPFADPWQYCQCDSDRDRPVGVGGSYGTGGTVVYEGAGGVGVDGESSRTMYVTTVLESLFDPPSANESLPAKCSWTAAAVFDPWTLWQYVVLLHNPSGTVTLAGDVEIQWWDASETTMIASRTFPVVLAPHATGPFGELDLMLTGIPANGVCRLLVSSGSLSGIEWAGAYPASIGIVNASPYSPKALYFDEVF